MVSLAEKYGAKGINIAGMCCTGNEILMRHGAPIAGNFLQQELAVITGAVDAMIVDVQCIMPVLGDLCSCFHTRFISTSPKAKRFEFRCPDPSCNPYLAFAALTMAAVDGIQNKIKPGDPLDKNIYDLPPEEAAKVPKTPGTLREALSALSADHAFLLKGDVFTKDVIDYWIDYKMENEVNPIKLRPVPYEFMMYYDV